MPFRQVCSGRHRQIRRYVDMYFRRKMQRTCKKAEGELRLFYDRMEADRRTGNDWGIPAVGKVVLMA